MMIIFDFIAMNFPFWYLFLIARELHLTIPPKRWYISARSGIISRTDFVQSVQFRTARIGDDPINLRSDPTLYNVSIMLQQSLLFWRAKNIYVITHDEIHMSLT